MIGKVACRVRAVKTSWLRYPLVFKVLEPSSPEDPLTQTGSFQHILGMDQGYKT